jgi:ankyrin repeat protein
MAYFYCDFRDPKKQDVSGLLASLLAQFSAKSDPCYNVLSALYSKYDAGSRQPNEVALTECLKAVLNTKGQPPIFIFIDAIDECPNSTDIVSPRDRVLILVEKLVVLRLPHVRICLTSRPEADIRASLESLASHTISLHDQNGQSHDIADYVRFVVHSDRNMQRWREEDKELVIEALSLKADGMCVVINTLAPGIFLIQLCRFRWIVCQLVMLRRCLPAGIRRAMEDLPRSLDETYERILLSIGEERWDYAQRLFQCLAVSIRPLRVDELAEVLAIQFNAGALPSYDVTLRPEDSQDAILSTCSSLIMIVDVDGSPVVQFSHFSVKEYLSSDRLAKAGKELSRYHIVPESAHTVLAQASLSILRTLDPQVDKGLMKNFPFAIYAARHWVDHAQFENVSSSVEDAMELLFDSTESHFTTWVWIYDVDYPFREVMFAEHPTPPEAVPLYYATLCGFDGLVGRLVATCPQDVNARGGFYATPLHAAVAKGNLVMARLLLAHKADATALNDELLTPLHWASRKGDREAVEFLIKHYADINIQDDCGQTSLMLASRYGQQDIVNLLLQCGAAVDISDHNSRTPLMLASRDGQPDVARLLLQSGAALDSKDDNGWTPLMFASGYGHPGVVSLSLQNGAAVNDHDDDGWTSLMLASENGHLDIVRLLLQNGAAVDSHHNDGWTSLVPASQNGHLDVVRLLLQNGATVDSRDKDGWTPLMSASRAGHQDIVHLFLQQGAAVSSHDKNDWTALMSACQAGHSDIVQLLLQNGAAVDSQGKNGLSPCRGASRFPCLSIRKQLLTAT